MKLIWSISAALLMAASVLVQVFTIRSEQAVVCKVVNGIIQTASVGMPLSLLSGMAASATMHAETHAATTHDSGLFHLNREEGMLISGRIAAIAWSAGLYFDQTDTDLDGPEHSSLSAAIQLWRVSNVWYANISAGSLPQSQSSQEISGEQESTNVRPDNSTVDKPYWDDAAWITSSRGSWSARSPRPTGDFW